MKYARFWLGLTLAAALTAGVAVRASSPSSEALATGSLGAGTVTLWQQGSQLGVTIDKAALASLPSHPARVDLTPAAPPFKLVEIDWEAHGHPPQGIYTVPHFDAHFYFINKKQRDAIAFAAPGKAPTPAPDLVPAGYVTDGSVEPQMGMHYIPASAPEFHGKPFMATQIWGYDQGRPAFVEAMFSMKFIAAHHRWARAVARPGDPPASGLPRRMAIRPNAAGGYDVVLSR